MPFLRKWIYAGDVIEAAEYYSIRTPKFLNWERVGTRPIRNTNFKITSLQQQKLNNRNAVNHLCRLLNANFKKKDFFITLDFAEYPKLENGEPDEQAVKEIMSKFNRRLRKTYQLQQFEFKYLYVVEKATETKAVRIHIHEVIPQSDANEIMKAWTWGGCTIRRLDSNRDYRGIANYLSKDPTLGTNHKKRWCGSKNLIQPKVVCKQIRYPGGEVAPPKGYKAILDRQYVSDITGLIRYVRFVRCGDDLSGLITSSSRAGPDPIPIINLRE